MSDRVFLDSNILVYTIGQESMARSARAAMARGHVISVQVLNEFANVARRKGLLQWAEIREAALRFAQVLEIVPLTVGTHDQALALAERYGFAFYDSLIVAAALDAGCDVLYTEDLQHKQLIDGRLRVVNPFA